MYFSKSSQESKSLLQSLSIKQNGKISFYQEVISMQNKSNPQAYTSRRSLISVPLWINYHTSIPASK